jgi:hypothetical protein
MVLGGQVIFIALQHEDQIVSVMFASALVSAKTVLSCCRIAHTCL